MANLRIGQGYDTHRFCEGRPLRLGGITVPHDRGLEGHSDADVLLHAIADALLGALSRGDIGVHFPNDDEVWKDADSRDLLSRVKAMVVDDGWNVVNLDATVITEAPRLRPYVTEMESAIAGVLGVSVSACNVKATTNERMGSVGRGEGIAALAVVLLEKRA